MNQNKYNLIKTLANNYFFFEKWLKKKKNIQKAHDLNKGQICPLFNHFVHLKTKSTNLNRI